MNRGESPIGASSAKSGDAQASRRAFEFTLDRDWRFTGVSEGAAAWGGSFASDLIGRDSRKAWAAPPEQVVRAMEAAFAGTGGATLELQSFAVPGRWSRVEIEPHPDGARVRFEDITSEVAQGESPATAEDGDALALGAGAAEIVLLDRQGVIVSANRAWHAAVAALELHLPRSGIGAHYAGIGRLLGKASVPEMDEVAFQRQWDDLVAGRSSQIAATYRLSTPHGQELRHVQITPLPLGNATYFAAIHEDLTERARVLAALSDTSDQLLQAQEHERQRIAIELHDSMSQHLAAMVLGLGRLDRRVRDDRDAREIVDELSKLTQQAIKETRVLSYLMNALADDRRGLEASVRQFVEGFGRRAGLATAFEAQGAVDRVNAAVQHALFRTIQEALSNVYRHARANSVSVELISRGGVLTARVSDNGRGIALSTLNQSDPPMGVGIPGMRARIHQLGGTLEIAGDASGTIVTATVPAADQTSSTQAAGGVSG